MKIDTNLQLNQLEKEKTKPKANTMKENKKDQNTDKLDRELKNPKLGSLTRLTKFTNLQLDGLRGKKQKTKITKIKDENGDITINSGEIKRNKATTMNNCMPTGG